MRDDSRDIDRELSRFGKLVVLLEDWATWMHGYYGVSGYSGHSAGISSGYCSKTFDALCEDVEAAVFKAIDAEVDSLPITQTAAINRRYGIASVFRFPRDNYADCLMAAHESLIARLPKRGVVL